MKTALRSSALVLLLLAAVQAADVNTLQPQGYVNDFAGVIDAAARQDIEQYCARVERATGAQMALVTVDTIGDEPIEDFANQLFVKWGIGKKGTDEGLLLLLVIGDRRSRLEVGRGLEPYITDGTSGTLLREMRPALRAGRYGEAMGTAAHSLGQRIAAVKGVTIEESYTPRRRVPRSEQEGGSIPFPLLVGGMFLLFWVLSMMGRGGRGGRGGGGMGGLLPGLILGHMMGRSGYGGGYGGGGFGGYDSGDSFGGFGGGDSGGGGASSDW